MGKIAIVTNACYNQTPGYIKYTDELKRRCCEKWDMSYERTDGNPHPGMHAVFCKFRNLINAMKKGFDWLVWMDCDAAPVTMEADLSGWLDTMPRKVVMLKDALGWNAGVFAVPCCDRAMKWLEWLDRPENLKKFDKGYRDQDEMAYTFSTHYADFIVDDGYEFGFNNYDDLYKHSNKPNLFIEGRSWCLHIPGYNNEYREERFRNIVRKMDGLGPFVEVKKNDLEGKTVADYIKDGAKNILIDYPHGLGDLIMFYPHFKAFCEQHKDCRIDLKPADAFRSLLPETDDEQSYEVSIQFPARFNERTTKLQGYTKPECNVKFDLGGEYNPELDYTEPLVKPVKGHEYSPFVGVNFFCTHFPAEGNCPENIARSIWDKLLENGFIPFELFIPKMRRVENIKYPFIRTSMRDIGPGIDRMMNVMASVRGVAAVTTGTWHYGMAAYPETTLYLQKAFKVTSYTRKPALVLDVNRPDKAVLNEWIERLKNASEKEG